MAVRQKKKKKPSVNKRNDAGSKKYYFGKLKRVHISNITVYAGQWGA